MRRPITTAAALVALLAGGEALASPLPTYGFGSRETSLASAATAVSEGPAAVFYNPAGLAHATGLTLQAGYLHVRQRLQIGGRDTGVDPVKGLNLGLVAPGRIAGIPFAFGLAVHLPDERLSRVRTLRQEIPRWELYDNRAQILFLAVAASVRPLPWLSLGGGVAFLSSTRGNFGITGEANLREPTDSPLRHEVDADLTAVRIPLLGVRVEPHRRLSVGLTYRGESKLDLRIDADIRGQVDTGIGGLKIPVTYTLSSRSFDAFQPRQVALGTRFSATDALRLSLDFVWTNWSSYQSATSRTVTDLQIDTTLNLAIPPNPKPTVVRDPQFRDRLVPRLGAEWSPWVRPAAAVAVRAGYAYELSPVPPQNALTNFVDGDRHTLATGAGVKLRPDASWFTGEVALDAHAALAILPERETRKRSAADFVGDYR
ncbi:MAG: hypothetical protein EOO75_13420, partial [Myxococcales bacterium]